MNTDCESFQIEIDHNGNHSVYPAELRTMGYTYKVFVQINGREIIFEPDEERNFRAVVAAEPGMKVEIDQELLKKIVHFLEDVFK